MFWQWPHSACLVSVAALVGCGWAGRPAALPPSDITESADSSKSDPVSEQSATKTRFTKLLSSASPEAKPRQSLDEMFLFQPIKIPAGRPQTAPLPFEDVELTSCDGTRLKAWWVAHPQPHAVVLYLHGNGGNLWYLQDILRWLNETAECSVMAVDYRGYGESEGTPTVAGVLDDVRAARTEAARRGGIDETDIVLMGRSLGGALAIQSAKESPPRGLVLESTFTTLEEVGRVHLGTLAKLVPNDRLDSLAALSSYSGPLLHSHGSSDRVIPYEHGVRLHAVATGPKRFIPIAGGDHNDPPNAEYLVDLKQFLRTLP